MFRKLHPVVCVNGRIIFFLKLGFWQIGVFTKYGCFNPSKWPQMPQKWVNTIPFGSGHTLGTLNYDLGPLFCCFITLCGAGGSLDPPGAPWRPPGPPGAPMTPGMSSWAIVSHPGSLWVIFDPSGVDNSSVYTAVRPYPPHPKLNTPLEKWQKSSFFEIFCMILHPTPHIRLFGNRIFAKKKLF